MAEGAATAGQGRGRQGGDPPVARQQCWQTDHTSKLAEVSTRKLAKDAIAMSGNP